jgi:hypothetical protein
MHKTSLLLWLLIALEASEGFGGLRGLLPKIGTIRLKNSNSRPTSWKMNSLAEAARGPLTVIGAPIPRLYVYDHCPFCVRVRFIMGIKNIKHNVVFLANDDVETPKNLVKFIRYKQPRFPELIHCTSV